MQGGVRASGSHPTLLVALSVIVAIPVPLCGHNPRQHTREPGKMARRFSEPPPSAFRLPQAARSLPRARQGSEHLHARTAASTQGTRAPPHKHYPPKKRTTTTHTTPTRAPHATLHTRGDPINTRHWHGAAPAPMQYCAACFGEWPINASVRLSACMCVSLCVLVAASVPCVTWAPLEDISSDLFLPLHLADLGLFFSFSSSVLRRSCRDPPALPPLSRTHLRGRGSSSSPPFPTLSLAVSSLPPLPTRFHGLSCTCA